MNQGFDNGKQGKKATPPKTSGGGGFVFEDKVAAFYLAHMLQDIPPFEPELGTLQRIDLQTEADGWYLDDILLTLEEDGQVHRIAISVKSNEQFSASGAPAEFVERTWKQYLHVGSDSFDKDSDYLALATAPLPHNTRKAIDSLTNRARSRIPVD